MNGIIEEIISQNLLRPVNEFCGRRKKNVRARLVELGFRLSLDQEPEDFDAYQKKIQEGGNIVESIHNGSLIVDDVQDGSLTRRSAPSLHLLHGVPLAINAGNWLYFRALTDIKNLELEPHVEMNLIQDIIQSMMKAHTGQAIDLGTKIESMPQESVRSICQASMELKTGVLMSLAMRLGSAIASTSEEIPKVSETAVRLGVFLQMLDDAGNLFGNSDKKFEDILQKRPTWIWSVASTLESYQEFVTATRDINELIYWMEKEDFHSKVQEETEREKNFLISRLHEHWGESHPRTLKDILMIIHQLEMAYEKN